MRVRRRCSWTSGWLPTLQPHSQSYQTRYMPPSQACLYIHWVCAGNLNVWLCFLYIVLTSWQRRLTADLPPFIPSLPSSCSGFSSTGSSSKSRSNRSSWWRGVRIGRWWSQTKRWVRLGFEIWKRPRPSPLEGKRGKDAEWRGWAVKLRSFSFCFLLSSAGLTGMKNLGNSCYMNAALQALSNW